MTILIRDNYFSPLDQFAIRNLLSIEAPILGDMNFSLANIGLYLTISTFLILTLYLISNNYNKVVSNNWSASQESVYATIWGFIFHNLKLFSLFVPSGCAQDLLPQWGLGLLLASDNSDQDTEMRESVPSPNSSLGEHSPSIPGSDELPELESPRQTFIDSESSSDAETGIDPKTSDIINLARDAEQREGSRLEKSQWLRGQFDLLMQEDREESLGKGLSEDQIQDQKLRYTQIILDRIEYKDVYAGRDWVDLDSQAVSDGSTIADSDSEEQISSVSAENQLEQEEIPQNPVSEALTAEQEEIPQNPVSEALTAEQEEIPQNSVSDAIDMEQEEIPQIPVSEAMATEQEEITQNPLETMNKNTFSSDDISGSSHKRARSEESEISDSNKKPKTETQGSLLDDFADTSQEMPSFLDEE